MVKSDLAEESTYLMEKIEYYSHFQPSPLSMAQFLDFGRAASEKDSFAFLKKELIVRLANIMKEISLLPGNLLKMPSSDLVREMYQQSFKECLEFEDADVNDREIRTKFTDQLQEIRDRHVNVVPTMAQGVIELREAFGIDHMTENQIQYFLDRFYMSRISIRMLINQHILLFSDIRPSGSHIGCIDPRTDVVEVVKDAYSNARFLCEQYYLTSPEVKITPHNPYEKTDDINIVYVPSHLYHIMFELFKNSMRAVIEYHGTAADSYPPIDVMVCKGKHDLSIRLQDQGGGIPHNAIDKLFKYMYTTAPEPSKAGGSLTPPFAGYGYGLPLSRLYAKYFQGDLVLTSIEAFGTTAHIYLKVLPKDSSELLPIFNKTCLKQYAQAIPVADWSNPVFTTGLHTPITFHQKRRFSSQSPAHLPVTRLVQWTSRCKMLARLLVR